MPIRTVKASGFQEFTASGNFTVPAGVTTVFVSGCGGGGGAGYDGNNAPAPGGGGLSFVRRPVTVTPGAVMPVVIGSGGASGNNGTGGGSTTFAGLTMYGGVGGKVSGQGAYFCFGGSTAFGQGNYGNGTGYGCGGGVDTGPVASAGRAGYLLIEW